MFFTWSHARHITKKFEEIEERLQKLTERLERISRKENALEDSHSNLVDEVQEMKVWAELAEKIFKRPEAAQAQNQADSNISADT